MNGSRAWAEVNLDALSTNLAAIRRRIGPRAAIVLVAKADAYGHGAVAVAHHAAGAGVQAIAVTTCAEALELRRAGLLLRILVLGPVPPEEAANAVRSGLELCLPSHELLRAAESAAAAAGRVLRVHVKVDTGFGRLGTSPAEAPELLQAVRRSPWLDLAGVMTHLAATGAGGRHAGEGDHEEAEARLQLDRFAPIAELARAHAREAGRDLWVHVANSAAVLSGLAPTYDAVRVGIAAYGVSPTAELAAPDLVPLLSVRTRVVHLRELRPGARVGYGGTWRAARPSRIAVLPIGYADGLDWRLGGRGWSLLRGRRVPLVGRISMDYATVDVTDVPGVALGDVVTLIGRDGGERVGVDELARLAGTIPYAVTCSIGERVARTYVASGPTADSRGGPTAGASDLAGRAASG